MKEKLSVVLIDDNEFDLLISEKFLQIKGLSDSILKFEYGKDALFYLENASSEQWPDLIFLDIHMPVMNGFEFMECFEKLPSEKRKQTHILMISSTLDKSDNLKVLSNSSVLALITKPLDMDALVALLRSKGILSIPRD